MNNNTQSHFHRPDLLAVFAGESNIYTLGNIGAHRVVCTKLPTVGHDRSASIAAGNTTTRLLGKERCPCICVCVVVLVLMKISCFFFYCLSLPSFWDIVYVLCMYRIWVHLSSLVQFYFNLANVFCVQFYLNLAWVFSVFSPYHLCAGTFQKVDHVFLVGTAGGVPHYTDYNKHVRLGDVVVATPPAGQKWVSSQCSLTVTIFTEGLISLYWLYSIHTSDKVTYTMV